MYFEARGCVSLWSCGCFVFVCMSLLMLSPEHPVAYRYVLSWPEEAPSFFSSQPALSVVTMLWGSERHHRSQGRLGLWWWWWRWGGVLEEVRGVGWVKDSVRWAGCFFTGVNEFMVSRRSVRDAIELPLGHPWCVSGYTLTPTHACTQTVRYVNTCTAPGKQVGARTGAVPRFFFSWILCACEIGASSSSKIHKRNLWTTVLSC